jgi:transcription antitermination factor NusG
MQAAWFAVHVKPRQEEVVCKRFGDIGVSTFLPQFLLRRRHGSRRWQALEPLFPGYGFAHFVPEVSLVYKLSWTSGVKRLLGDHEGPTPVPDDVIVYLKRRVEPLGCIVPQGKDERRAQPMDNADSRIVRLERIIDEPVSAAERVRVLMELEC